jgi:bifunctional non-homologous end joining protein LigD
MPVPVVQTNVLRRLNRLSTGVHFSEHIEGDGPTIFEHACKPDFEGIVSNRRDLRYRSGRGKSWIKRRNPTSPAELRAP